MVRLPGIRHPSSVVYSQVDFYPHHDVGQERSSYPCQYPQVEQLVGNSKQQNIGDKVAVQNPNFIVMCWGLDGAE